MTHHGLLVTGRTLRTFGVAVRASPGGRAARRVIGSRRRRAAVPAGSATAASQAAPLSRVTARRSVPSLRAALGGQSRDDVGPWSAPTTTSWPGECSWLDARQIGFRGSVGAGAGRMHRPEPCRGEPRRPTLGCHRRASRRRSARRRRWRPARRRHRPPAAPAAPACGDPRRRRAMSTRDKLAQLLMVGVTDADDARAVVDNQHVGGIMIGSWTDLSMLSDGSLADIAADGRPAAAGGQRRRGGRPGVAAVRTDRRPALAARAGADQHPGAGVRRSRSSAGRKMRDLGITIDFAPVVDVTDEPDDTVIGDRSFGVGSRRRSPTTRAPTPRGLRDAGLLPVLKHFPGHGHGVGRLARGRCGHPAAGRSAGRRPDARTGR